MRLTLDDPARTVIDVDERQLLGEGGEARVFAVDADRACKLYHPNLPPRPERLAKLRALRDLQARGLLPDTVIAPIALVVDPADAVLGLIMRRIAGAMELGRLGGPKRPAHLSQQSIVTALASLHTTVLALHTAGVVVGDLNDGNVLVDVAVGAVPTATLIDTDSVQVAGWPCPVAHERTLDPRLYGVALDQKPVFDVDSDLYAFRVLLFMALVGVHPYGGVHPTLPTLTRRAQARHSVLRKDVVMPRIARPLNTLPEALLADFKAAFDDDVRAPFDVTKLLLSTMFVRCGCGLEHAHRRCPGCSVTVAVRARTITGDVDVCVLVDGITVAVAFDGACRALRLVDDRDGISLTRENGDVVLVGAPPAGLEAAIAGGRTWLALPDGDGAQLIAIEAGVVVDRTSTGLVYGSPAWALGPAGLFHLSGDAIVHHQTGTIVGRALIGSTWLFAVDDGVLAIWRAGRVLRAQWCRVGHGATDIALPAVDGKVRLITVTAHGERAVVALSTDSQGRVAHRLTAIHRSRGVTATTTGGADDDDSVWLDPARPRLLQGHRLLTVDGNGLLVCDIDDAGAAFVPTLRFDDDATVDAVSHATALLPGSGSDLVVVTPTAVTRCRRRAPTTTAPVPPQPPAPARARRGQP